MSNYSIGGQNRADFFRLKDNGTGYDFLSVLTSNVAALPALTDVAFTANKIVASDLQKQEDGTVKVNLDHADVSTGFWAYLDKVAVPSTTIARPELKLENGIKHGGTSGTGDPILGVFYLQGNDEDNPTKILVYMMVGKVAPTSGAIKTDPDNYNKPSYEFNSNGAVYELTIPADCFDDAIITAAEQTIPKLSGYECKFIAKAA